MKKSRVIDHEAAVSVVCNEAPPEDKGFGGHLNEHAGSRDSSSNNIKDVTKKGALQLSSTSPHDGAY